jgi:hypothetical protein
LKSNGEKLAELFVKHEDIMYNAVLSRQYTSLGNKELHQEMLNALILLDVQMVLASIYNPYYTKPLEGVIICSDLEFNDKNVMLELFNNFVEEKNYGK